MNCIVRMDSHAIVVTKYFAKLTHLFGSVYIQHACVVVTLQNKCYFSKVFGYYNCVTILTMQFTNAVMKKIHAVRADT